MRSRMLASAALTARGYSRSGRLVLDVVDPGGYAAGRFVLDASPDGTECHPAAGATADLTLPAGALASVLLDLNDHAVERHSLGSGPPRQ